MSVTLLLALLAAISAGALVGLILVWRRLSDVSSERDRVKSRFRGVVDAEEERTRVLRELERERGQAAAALQAFLKEADGQRARMDQLLTQTDANITELTNRRDVLQAEVSLLDEEATLHSFGVYKPHYSFATSALYADRLERVRDEQKAMIRNKTAAYGTVEWLVNGSKREGQKQINQTVKLMLRAFNGECDAAIAKVRYNNLHVMEARIEKAYEMLTDLASVQKCEIARAYLVLKLDELHLAFEYEEKKQEEKEEQRRIREQMREEETARRELERARENAEKEEERAAAALEKARREVADAVGAKQARLVSQIEELERRLVEAQTNKERAISRAQLTRSGHVYVISNIGSFGDHVYKIGMTRRLDPMERIWELGDASVPFDFDVHAVIYSEDAPGLENALHKAFHRHRINRINDRKEFFHVTIDAIAEVVRNHRADVQITLAAEAADYWKTQALLLEEERYGMQVSTLQRFSVPTPRRIPAPVAPQVPAGTDLLVTAPIANGSPLRGTILPS
jgi:multidrug efflux pump subunit AcrA (membrane-fusion protein)/flagellar motility protein MotE (MotC chaperone)